MDELVSNGDLGGVWLRLDGFNCGLIRLAVSTVMDTNDDIPTRLREERERLGLSQVEVGSFAGIDRKTQGNYESGKRSPDATYLGALAAQGVDVLYVITGRREKAAQAVTAEAAAPTSQVQVMSSETGTGGFLLQAQMHLVREATGAWLNEISDPKRSASSATTQTGGPSGQRLALGALLPSEQGVALQPLVLQLMLGDQSGEVNYHVIPRRVLPASAGPGLSADAALRDQVDLAGDMAFTSDWLRRNLGHTSGSICSVQVRGDSMAGTLLDGETILVDQGVAEVDVDGIYVLEIYGRQLVKRVQRLVDGSLVLISDNAQYAREQIPRDTARDVRVVGRMVYPRMR